MRTSLCDQFTLCGVSWVITSRNEPVVKTRRRDQNPIQGKGNFTVLKKCHPPVAQRFTRANVTYSTMSNLFITGIAPKKLSQPYYAITKAS